MDIQKRITEIYNKLPIIIIDDSPGERELVKVALADLGVDSELIFFDNGFTFLEYIRTETTGAFFILCDINMPGLSGMDIKKILQDDEALRLKSIPFILFSTSNALSSIKTAYSFGVQGYFVKPDTVDQLMDMLYAIVSYWNFSESPS